MSVGHLHHVELWVPNLERATASWGWLLLELGYQPLQRWSSGCSWQAGDAYIVLEQSSALIADAHDRLRPGLNHLAFHGGARSRVNQLASQAQEHGWRLLFADRHPFAGGPQHFAAYLEDPDGFEVELVASY